MATSTSVFGRAKELEALGSAIDRARSGRGQLLLLAGEAGIGKTRLFDEAAQQASKVGFAVAWGRGWEGGGAPAYWPWIEIARSLAEPGGAPAAIAQRIVARLSEVKAGAERDLDATRFQLFDAVRADLVAISEHRPLFLVFDDLHDFDLGSASLLHFLARGLRSIRAMIGVTYRDQELRARAELSDLASKAAREGVTIALGRLGAEDAALLAEARVQRKLSPDILSSLFAASLGHPLFQAELAELLRARGAIEGLPQTVREVILRRLRTLDSRSLDALQACAVIGRELTLPVLAGALAEPIEGMLSRLSAAVRGGWLLDGGGLRFSFSHPLIREVLYEELPAQRKAELHAAVKATLDRLVRSGAEVSLEELAHHASAAVPVVDAETASLACARAGAAALEHLAFDRAADLQQRALDLAERAGGDVLRRIDLLLDAGRASIRAGARAKGKQMALRAAELARSAQDPRRLARAALLYGIEFEMARIDPLMVELLEESSRGLGPEDLALLARVRARLGAALQPAIDPNVPMQIAREAIEMARRSGDQRALLEALYAGGSAFADYAEPAERAAYGREMIELALRFGERTMALRGYARLVIDYVELGDLAACDAAIEHHADLAKALGPSQYRWMTPLLRAMRAQMEGRFSEAQALAEEGRVIGAQSEDPDAARVWMIQRFAWLREVGTIAELEAHGAAVMRALSNLEGSAIIGRAFAAIAASRLRDRALAEQSMAGVDRSHPILRDPAMAACCADIIAITRERPFADELLGRAERVRGRSYTIGLIGLGWEGPAVRGVGLLKWVTGDLDGAVVDLGLGLTECERLGARPLASRTRIELAETLLERRSPGDLERARALLGTAIEECDRLGMTRLAEHGRGVEAALGEAPSLAPTRAETMLEISREGELWRIARSGRSVVLKGGRGLEIIAKLAADPGREIHVLDLLGGGDTEVIDLGDSGVLLDDAAKSAYRRRAIEIQEELDQAEAWSDRGRADRLREELEALGAELSRGVGLGGRDRRAGVAAERARINVQKRVKEAIKKIADADAKLGQHLEWAVRTGVYCIYRPSN